MRLAFTLLALIALAQAKLSSNWNGYPQELKLIDTSVCDGRSSICSVLMDVPSPCAGDNSSCPIIMMFHGHGGNNQHYSGRPVSVYNYGFIGIYPQGELYNGRSGWNDGSMDGLQCEWDQYNCTKDPNDSNFVLAIVLSLRSLGAYGRVYAYGTSNGANEVQILGANSMAKGQLPIVGIAARSGQMLAKPTRSGPGPFDWNQPCAGDNPCEGGSVVAQLSIHDLADPVIPYAGGARFNSPVFILSDEEVSCATWARQNNCSATQTNTTVDASTHQGSTTAKFIAWDGCPDVAPVELYKVSGGSHVGTVSLRGEDVLVTVFEFFTKVEKAHGGHPQPGPSPPVPPPSPPPSPDVPSVQCQSCFKFHCASAKAKGMQACDACVDSNQWTCASSCMPFPFPKAKAWYCGQ